MAPYAVNPILQLNTGIGQKALSPEVRRYITNVMKDLPLIAQMQHRDVQDTFTAFYHGKKREDALWQALSVLEFVAGSLRMYQTQPGVPFGLVVGAYNSKYSSTSQAFMYDVDAQQVTALHAVLKMIRASQWWVSSDGPAELAMAIKTTYDEQLRPILACLLEVRFGGVTHDQKSKWRF